MTDKNLWYLDSSVSNHMCGHKELFTELDEKVNGEVSFGDASKVKVAGVGKIFIKLKDENHQYIFNIYYVPKMKTNILSLGQPLEKGYEVQMKDGHMHLRKENKLIAHVPMSMNRMFGLNIDHVIARYLNACLKNSGWF
ncbi:RNA-directed DNA polymerase protein [Dioscorea alata]|uniref:RNA-directed DNA polymerase protein n=1 Tax=Dioscorea alata TaxID=55571 RepID=A0ACB7WCZ5_DIOAL|nr:RNA-directed DNA polymerase protein [Dioscorea alata]